MKIDEYFDNLYKYNNNYSNKKYETNKFINFSRVQLLELKRSIPDDIIKKIEAIDRNNLNTHDSNSSNSPNSTNNTNNSSSSHS